MASKSGASISMKNQSKSTNTGLPAPEKATSMAQEVASKNVINEASFKQKSSQKGHISSLADKLDSGLSLHHLPQTPKSKNPAASETRGSLGSLGDVEKKTSELGTPKDSLAAKVSDGSSSLAKTSGSAKISDKADFVESGKSSMCRGSTSTDISDESTCSSLSSSVSKPHKANDSRWEAIQAVRAKDGALGLSHFRLLKRLGCGDIGSVYLAELSSTKCYFAMKVMDKALLASRKKLLRAQTEREILQSLDHPFLPTLYTHFETDKFSCLVMEFCPGGDLHTLRQRQQGKHFSEQAVKYDFSISYLK